MKSGRSCDLSLKVNSYTAWGAGNVGDEVSIAVGFSLSSDWSKGWCKLSSPITGRSYVGEERYYHYQYFLSSLFS